MVMAELIYLSSDRFDRKSRARSATPTSLIIERSRHPFHEKTDAMRGLMGALEMMQIIILMESGGVVAGRLIVVLRSSSWSGGGVEVSAFAGCWLMLVDAACCTDWTDSGLRCEALRWVVGGGWMVLLGRSEWKGRELEGRRARLLAWTKLVRAFHVIRATRTELR